MSDKSLSACPAVPLSPSSESTRRDFLKGTSAILTAGALVGVAVPHVHAAEDNTVRVALVGCGGRGTGAASNALSVKNGPIKLTAMADVFDHRLKTSLESIKQRHNDQVEVPEDHKFIGFEAYKQALDTLRPGDVAIFATPPAFRWVQFTYAIEKGINVFMEKPVTVDGPSSRRMFKLGEAAAQKNLKVSVGLMCRHCEARQELFDRVQNGEMGDLITLRSYRMHPPVGSAFSEKKPDGESEVLYQIRRFHSFLWASGGCFSDFYIHNIDECCWIKNAWPVEAQASGGRQFRGDYVDQNFDNYSVEFTFADGSKLLHYGRTMAGCHDQFASYAHGSKGMAVISSNGHWPSHAAIYKGQKVDKDNVAWSFGKETNNPYQVEWDRLIAAIREDKPHNEVERGVKASLVTSMGRMAAHTGQIIKYEDILNHDHEFAPDVDKLTVDGPAPLLADASGHYPIPMPGINASREY
jgi:predicted dehydrogenase